MLTRLHAHRSWAFLFFLSFLMGCGNLRQEGLVVAAHGEATADNAVAYYEKLEAYARSSRTLDVIRDALAASSAETPDQKKKRIELREQALKHYTDRIDAIVARKELALALKETYGSLGALSEYDARGAVEGSAAEIGVAIDNVIAKPFPNVTVGGVLKNALLLLRSAQQSADIREGAEALDAVMVGFDALLEAEMVHPVPVLGVSVYEAVIAERILRAQKVVPELMTSGALDYSEYLASAAVPAKIKLKMAALEPMARREILEEAIARTSALDIDSDAKDTRKLGDTVRSGVKKLLTLHDKLFEGKRR